MSAVTRCSQPAVPIVTNGRDAVPIRTGGNDRLDFAARVVDDDDLEILVRLCRQAGESRSEAIRSVVRRDDDGDLRNACHGNEARVHTPLAHPHLINGKQVHRAEIGRCWSRNIPEARHLDMDAFKPQLDESLRRKERPQLVFGHPVLHRLTRRRDGLPLFPHFSSRGRQNEISVGIEQLSEVRKGTFPCARAGRVR